MGDREDRGVPSLQDRKATTPGPWHLGGNEARFTLRARAPGALNANSLWAGAIGQVKKGWLEDPLGLGDKEEC